MTATGSGTRGPEGVGREVFRVMVFMLSSAKGLFDEPKEYGPLRLIDATGRLAAALERCGCADAAVRAVAERVAKELDDVLSGEAETVAFLDGVLAVACSYL